jgi:hypothetical protein
MGKLVDDTAVDPGVNVKVQVRPGPTLAQVLPVSETLPLSAVEVKLDTIPVAVSVPELLVIVIELEAPLVSNSIGLPAVIEMGTSVGAFTAMLADTTEVLLPLMLVLVDGTATVPGVNFKEQVLPGPTLVQLLAS